jgi:4-hydroxy-tetrahydrodipicolinate synthase
VSSNVAPDLCATFFNAVMSGDWKAALYWQDRLIRLHKGLFSDASPSPTKFALSHLGLCLEDARLPIVACSEAARTEVLAAMRDAGVI